MTLARDRLGLLLGLAGVVIFGATLPITRLAVADLSPWFVTFGRAALAGVWAEEKNLNDEAVIRRLIDAAGFNADEVIAAARSAEIQRLFAKNGEDAIKADVFGAPAYVLDGEFFAQCAN